MKLFGLVVFGFLSFGLVAGPQDEALVIPDQIPVMTKEGAKLHAYHLNDSDVLTEIPAGTVLSATDAHGLFLLVEYEGQSGWIPAASLRFQKGGREFIEHRNKLAMAAMEEEKAKNKMKGRRNARQAATPDLVQCSATKENGQRCLYKTADPSGACPEHQ